MKVVILANGEFPKSAVPLQVLQEADHLVCCDGALQKLIDGGLYRQGMAVTVIGDGDSLPQSLASSIEFIQIPDQDSNDLTKATRHCISKGWCDITYLGATGLREDHTLGNIGLLSEYIERYPEAQLRMVSDFGIFTPVVGSRHFESFPEQQVSLFTLGADTKVSTHGLRWDVHERHLFNLWQGTLNAVVGSSFTICSQGGPTLVYQTHEAKL